MRAAQTLQASLNGCSHRLWQDSAAIKTTQSSIQCDGAAVTYHMESKQKQLTSAQRSLSLSSTKGGMSLSVLSTKVCISGLSLRDSKAGMSCWWLCVLLGRGAAFPFADALGRAGVGAVVSAVVLEVSPELLAAAFAAAATRLRSVLASVSMSSRTSPQSRHFDFSFHWLDPRFVTFSCSHGFGAAAAELEADAAQLGVGAVGVAPVELAFAFGLAFPFAFAPACTWA